MRDPSPAFLVLPGPRDRALPTVLRKVRLLALRSLLTMPVQDPALAALVGRVRGVLADLARQNSAVVLEAVGRVDVLNAVLVARAGLRPVDVMLEQALPTVLCWLAAKRALPEAVLWDRPVSTLIDDALGWTWRFEDAALGVLAHPGGAEFRLSDGSLVGLDDAAGRAEASRLGPALREGLRLALVDSNPLADVEAHPDKSGNGLSLGEQPLARWVDGLNAGLELVQRALPHWMAEMPIALQRVVPVGFEPERHLSASYLEAPGLAYLTLHPDPLTLAEALVHETQHSRLNLLSLLDPVLRNGRTAWTPSPVRPDLRPLIGVLLAVHAFVPVAVMHARLVAVGASSPQLLRRRMDVLRGNARGLEIVEGMGEPTALGRRLVGDLRRVHDWTVDQAGGIEGAVGALPG